MVRGYWLHRWFDGERFRDEPSTLRVARGFITGVEPGWAAEPDLIDARDRLALPGLIDTHVHVARAGFFEAEEPPLQVQQIARNLTGALRAGVTTVADMGCTVAMLRSLRRLTADDPLAGPRIVGAGPILTATGGYPFDWVSPLWRHAEAARAIDDDASARRAVARDAEHGMDHVKVAIMHESFARRPLPALAPGVARAVVGEAHALGRRVYAHAHSLADYRAALDAGVDALMHSCFEPLDRDDVARVRDAGVAVCPTLWAYASTCEVGDCGLHLRDDLQRHATPALRRSWQRFADAYAEAGDVFPRSSTVAGVPKASARAAMQVAAANLILLAEAGVPIAFGNDASFGVSLLARPLDEIAAMRAVGLDVRACLHAATGAAADLLGRADLGRLAPGCRADVLLAAPSLAVDLGMLDVDRPGVTLDVYAGGRRVPAAVSPRQHARIALAYLEGTGRTLARTAANAATAALATLR